LIKIAAMVILNWMLLTAAVYAEPLTLKEIPVPLGTNYESRLTDDDLDTPAGLVVSQQHHQNGNPYYVLKCNTPKSVVTFLDDDNCIVWCEVNYKSDSGIWKSEFSYSSFSNVASVGTVPADITPPDQDPFYRNASIWAEAELDKAMGL